jgi:GDP-L-fucose synthase
VDLNEKIYIAGHLGMVGSAIIRELQRQGFKNLIVRSHSELDLTNQNQVAQFFLQERPDYVCLAAAKVGGIHANETFPAEFIYENLMIQCNVIHQSYLNKVKQLIFLGSSCIYPKFTKQPIEESYLLTGKLEETNKSYAIAKISGIEMCQSYNKQYHTNFRSLMPTNLYGPGDNFHPTNSHVIPALIRRFNDAKKLGHEEIVIWGSGEPKREFLHVDDLAEATIHVMKLSKEKFQEITTETEPFLNIGYGTDISIRELVRIMVEISGYKGTIIFDQKMPNGTENKLLDSSKIKKTGWFPKVKLREGLKMTYDNYKNKSAE